MSTAEDPPPFFPPLPAPGFNDSGGFWLQVHPRKGDFDIPTQFKKQRVSDDVPMNTSKGQRQGLGILSPPPVPPNLPENLSQNNKVNRLFFKTRLCTKFNLGSCPYGQNCSFAHGPEELRRAPPNWPSLVAGHDDERSADGLSDRQRMNKFKICRKYYNGEVCPYGERCTFAHVEPGSFRESSAISVGVSESAPPVSVISVNGARDLEINGSSGSCGDGNASLQKSSFWKTKICHKWELTGDCPFGEKCHFAHRTAAELKKKYVGHIDAETNSLVARTKHIPSPAESVPSNKTGFPSKQKGFPRLKALKKISNIYADWIEEIPLNFRNS